MWLSQSRPGSNGNEGVLHIFKSSSVIFMTPTFWERERERERERGVSFLCRGIQLAIQRRVSELTNGKQTEKKMCWIPKKLFWRKLTFYSLSIPFLRMVNRLIGFNGMSTLVGLFYASRFENYIHCKFIFTFFYVVVP